MINTAEKHPLRKECNSSTHRQSGSPTYNVWCGMKARCNNPNDKNFYLYGARGIYVCARWGRFENFLSDMGARPSAGHSIERVNGLLGYSPDNCKWATAKEQGRNTTRNRMLEYGGTVKAMSQWCEELGLNYFTVRTRIRKGWPVKDAFYAPKINIRRLSPLTLKKDKHKRKESK
jgi:hypothetical protein